MKNSSTQFSAFETTTSVCSVALASKSIHFVGEAEHDIIVDTLPLHLSALNCNGRCNPLLRPMSHHDLTFAFVRSVVAVKN